ncbi:hypothetical protein BWGOE3_52200 [Bacillus mycoides]|uniref:hypothetical protein n=1 Tax=Bacillus cereus TaxID=1396 RepID=UPI00087335C2|nr:hypothetical protein BWGOE3_52200 [Bacillus mycoides]OFD55618.1 hypothetical protein BWGOE6_52410 [Bacillus mycoides]
MDTNNLLYTGVTRTKEDFKLYVPNENVLSYMLNTIPEPISDVTWNNVCDKVLDMKKLSF